MKLKYLTFLFLLLLTYPACCLERQFLSDTDISIIPNFIISIPINSNISINNINYPIDYQCQQFNLLGENLINGSSNITIKHRAIYVNDNNKIELTKRYLEVGLSSPIYYEYKQGLELGWLGSILYQRIETGKNNFIQVQLDSNLGGDIGMYSRIYNFYPFIPFINSSIIVGNFLDQNKLFNNNTFASSFKLGCNLIVGFDIYIKPILMGLSYNYWYLDSDNINSLNVKLGYIF